MHSINRIGQNRPLCKTRQFGTMGAPKLPEEMHLQPEYLVNNPFKLLNNFGLQQQLINDKKFVDISNCVCKNQERGEMLSPLRIMHNIASTVIPNYKTNSYKSCEPPPQEASTLTNHDIRKDSRKVTTEKSSGSTPVLVEGAGNSLKVSKKTKRNNKVAQKSSKRSKKYQKQSKRESDRNILNNNSLCGRKRKNGKSWHKQSLELEIMELDEENTELPVATPLCTIDLPNLTSCISVRNNVVAGVSSPVVIELQSKRGLFNNPICDFTQKIVSLSPKQNYCRTKLPSECESEDSFIVFEDGLKNFDLDDESTDCDLYDDDDDDDSSDDGDDVMSFSESAESPSCSPCKKVRFAVGKELCEVHPMVTWSFAYQKARKGPWEQYAVDRMRFKNRISHIEEVLSDILQPAHRSKIYQERFYQEQ